MQIDIESMCRNAGPASDLLKAMSNSHRFLILCHLIGGERSVGQLEAVIGISQSSLSQHLARLKRDSLVAARRDGQRIIYSLTSKEVPVVMKELERIFSP